MEPAGKYRPGRWAIAVNIAALVYGFAAVNISWPRTPDAPWYDNYVVLLMSGGIIGLGLLYMVTARPQGEEVDPDADAVALG